jgi:radical SAM-linked protein
MNRIRFRFSCGKEVRYLSHLDLLRLLQRAMRRAGLPLAYSRGFSPRIRLSLAAPLPVGVTASKEYGEVFLVEPLTPASFRRRLSAQLPKGLLLTGVVVIPAGVPPLASVVNAALYTARWKSSRPAPAASLLQKALDKLLAQPAIMIRRFGKSGKMSKQDIRPYIYSAALLPSPGGEGLQLRLLLQVGSQGGLSPSRFLEQLALAGDYSGGERAWRIHREGLYIYQENLLDPFPEGGEVTDG